jgi:protein-disulfide isomerase
MRVVPRRETFEPILEEMCMHSIPTRAGLGALLALTLAALPALAAPKKAGEDDVLAIVDGKPISESDVVESAPADFKALERDYRQKRHDLLQTGLDRLVEQKLLAAEAKKRGSSEEEVLEGIAAKPVTDADVDAFYTENQSRLREGLTKEQVAPQIRQYLEQVNEQSARSEFFAELRKQHAVDYRLEPLRVEVAATGPSRGPANAPVTIVEFADFQCPYCARILPALDQLMQSYGDKVRLVYRQFPLTIHNNAEIAARASLCANEQGKFWEMHDGMFANQRALDAAQLKTTAANLNLDADAFNECLDSGRYADQVAADTAAGTEAGVSGTPALFVNGRFIAGAVPLEDITKIVDDELRRRAN